MAIGEAIAGAASLVGGFLGNRGRAREARKGRRFAERMRSTEWQTAVADMRAAGINPALAYQQGGASSPGGSIATQEDIFTPAVSSAMQARVNREQVKLVQSQAKEAAAKAAVAENEKWWSSERREYYDPDKGPRGGITGGPQIEQIKRDRLYKILDSEHGERLAKAAREMALSRVAGLGGEVAGAFEPFMAPLQQITGVAGQGAGQLAGLISLLERGARMRDSAVQAYLGLPKRVVVRLLNILKESR